MDIDICQAENVMLSGEDSGVMASNKQQLHKRRAVFGDITNNKASAVKSGKKKCVENVPVAVVEIIEEEPPDIALAEDDDVAAVHTCCGVQSTNDNVVTPESEEMTVDWVDVDKDNTNPAFLSIYVNDIFNYYRQREHNFVISDYIPRQSEVSTNMRAVLVDWLVEVQQSFELVHETLYMAVKLTDSYLDRQKASIAKNHLQLIGSTALNIACKFEERSPPVVDDFLYVCDDAYTRPELLAMEKRILKAVEFDIGVPLSYTFLRRYAQCGRVSTPTLALARFILETSLMDYKYVSCLESKMAAACLLLAVNMNCDGQWDATLIHYTQYTVADLTELASQLNSMLVTPPYKSLTTILSKYSHRVFHEVAKIMPLDEGEMCLLQRCNPSVRSAVRHRTT